MRPTIKGQKGEWQPNFWESLPFPKIDGIILPFIVQSLSHVWLFATPWTAALQASLSFTITHSLLKFMSIEFSDAIQPSRPLITFSFCLQSLPASGSFPMIQLFASGGQSIGVSASASVLPMNVQGWFLLGLTGMILQSKGLWRVFSSTTVWRHQFFSTQPFSLISACDLHSHHFAWCTLHRS